MVLYLKVDPLCVAAVPTAKLTQDLRRRGREESLDRSDVLHHQVGVVVREQGEGAGGVEVPGSLSHAPLAAEGEELVGEEKVATLRGEEGR